MIYTNMNNIKAFTIFLLLMSLQSLHAQFELKIEIQNLESNKGVVIVDLLDKGEKTIEAKTCKISDNRCTVIFKELKNDQYAIRYFHDANANDELDTNILGIPKEGFGFSNDAFGKFGPKKFSEWLFTVSGDSEIKMTTRYL